MRQKKTKQMLDYWMDLYEQAGNSFQPGASHIWPERSDVQPSDCRSLLSDMFILEINQGLVEYRLAGTNLCSLYGRELKHEGFREAFAGSDQMSADNWAAQLGMDKVVVLICSLGESSRGELVNLETLLLPLAHHCNPAKRVLGTTVSCETPSWLGVNPIITQSIRSVRVLSPWEDHVRTAPLSPSAQQVLNGYFPNGSSSGTRPVVPSPPVQSDFKSNFTQFQQDPFLTENEINGGFEPVRKVGHLQVIEGGRSD